MATFIDTNNLGTNAATNRSAAAKAGLNLNVQPLEAFILQGLKQRLFEVFELNTAWLSSTDKAAAARRAFGNPSAENDLSLQYPYGFLTLTDLNTEAEPTLNTQFTSSLGFVNVTNGTDARAFRVTFVPCEFSITLEYVTNNQGKLLDFSKRMLLARRTGQLKYNVVYGRTTFSISVLPGSSISLPIREGGPDQAAEYALSVTLMVKGYLSNSTLLEQQVATRVEVTAEATPDLAKPGTTFWKFNSGTGTESLT